MQLFVSNLFWIVLILGVVLFTIGWPGFLFYEALFSPHDPEASYPENLKHELHTAFKGDSLSYPIGMFLIGGLLLLCPDFSGLPEAETWPHWLLVLDSSVLKYVLWLGGFLLMNVTTWGLVELVPEKLFAVQEKVLGYGLGIDMGPYNIKQLARRKVCGRAALYSLWIFGLFWLCPLMLFSSFPFTRGYLFTLIVVLGWATAIYFFVVLPVLLFLMGRSKLLELWFPSLSCPYCYHQNNLVCEWSCVAKCKSRKPRHVLAPCPMCGTTFEFMNCQNDSCQRKIYFDIPYNNFAIANRDRRYATEPNPFFWWAALVLGFALPLSYIFLQLGMTDRFYFFLALVFVSTGTLLLQKPRCVIRNVYFEEETNQCQKTVAK